MIVKSLSKYIVISLFLLQLSIAQGKNKTVILFYTTLNVFINFI